MTVVTPETIAQPKSQELIGVDPFDSSGPPPLAAAIDQIIIAISVRPAEALKKCK